MVAKRKLAGTKIGIKELKDRASEIVGHVARTHRPAIITKHGRDVAKIVPLNPHPAEILTDKGLIHEGSESLLPLKSLRLEPIALAADLAIQSLVSDRDER